MQSYCKSTNVKLDADKENVSYSICYHCSPPPFQDSGLLQRSLVTAMPPPHPHPRQLDRYPNLLAQSYFGLPPLAKFFRSEHRLKSSWYSLDDVDHTGEGKLSGHRDCVCLINHCTSRTQQADLFHVLSEPGATNIKTHRLSLVTHTPEPSRSGNVSTLVVRKLTYRQVNGVDLQVGKWG